MNRKTAIDDRFSRFGTVSFTATTRTNDFVTHLEAGRVSGTRCKGCDRFFFPPRADCRHCLESHVEWVAVTGTGRLLTYSRLHFAPVGFEADLPYAIALVDYGDFKIFGRLAGDLAEDDIRIGMALKVVPNRLPNGQLNYVFEI